MRPARSTESVPALTWRQVVSDGVPALRSYHQALAWPWTVSRAALLVTPVASRPGYGVVADSLTCKVAGLEPWTTFCQLPPLPDLAWSAMRQAKVLAGTAVSLALVVTFTV